MYPFSATPQARENTAIFSDVLSFGRNMATVVVEVVDQLADASKKVMKAVLAAGLVSGALNLFSGFWMVKGSIQDVKKAYRIEDSEGGTIGAASGVAGSSLSLIGGGMISGNIGSLSGHASVTALAGVITTAASFGFYGLMVLIGAYRLGMTGCFRRDLKEILEDQGFSGEKKRKKALRWIQEKIATDLGAEEFGRRTSPETLLALKKSLTTEFFHKLEEKDPAAELEAKGLIDLILKENFKNLCKQILLIGIGAIGITACVFSGPFAPLLFAIGALLWLCLDSKKVGKITGDWAWKMHERLYSKRSNRLKERECLPFKNSLISSCPKRGSQATPFLRTPMILNPSTSSFPAKTGMMYAQRRS